MGENLYEIRSGATVDMERNKKHIEKIKGKQIKSSTCDTPEQKRGIWEGEGGLDKKHDPKEKRLLEKVGTKPRTRSQTGEIKLEELLFQKGKEEKKG